MKDEEEHLIEAVKKLVIYICGFYLLYFIDLKW